MRYVEILWRFFVVIRHLNRRRKDNIVILIRSLLITLIRLLSVGLLFACAPQYCLGFNGNNSVLFNIKEQNLEAGLIEFCEQSGLEFVVPADVVSGKRGAAVSGSMTPDQALTVLLKDTQLRGTITRDGILVLQNNDTIIKRSEGDAVDKKLGFWSALTALFVASSPSQGQNLDGSESEFSLIEEVVVTARRREESIQDVPATIQALTQDDLRIRNIQAESDLQSAVPGLLIRTNNSQNQINYVIRGESMEPYSGSVPGVQPYFNEVALSGNTLISFYDIQSIQVLKGPQGTLFGRNSTGGAVLYQSVEPDADFGGHFNVQYGNRDLFLTDAAVNIPLVEDKAALRLAGKGTDGGAYVKNIYDNSDQGDTRIKSGRATLLLTPNDALKNVTMAQYDKFEGTNTGRFTFYVEPCGGVGNQTTCWVSNQNAFFQDLVTSSPGEYFPNYPTGYVYPEGLATFEDFLTSQGDHVLNQDSPSDYSGESSVGINTTTIELSPNLTLKNILGYAESERSFRYDNDSTPYPLLLAGGGLPGGSQQEHREVRTISDELQLQGTAMDGNLDYILGVIYSKERVINNSPIQGMGYIAAIDTPYTFAIRYRSRNEVESKAIFSQATYALTDSVNITAGFRQTWSKLSAEQQEFSVFFGGPDLSTDVDHESWTLTLDYNVNDNLMLYATTRGSWRVGGYNPFVAPVGDEVTAADSGNYFEPETIRDVEVGAKFSGLVAGMPLQLNLDLFRTQVENNQKTAYTVLNGRITSATVTVPESEIEGIEASFMVEPVNWLQLGFNFSYQQAEFTDNIAELYGQTARFGPFADSPDFSGSVFANVSGDLAGDRGTLNYHIDLYSQSSFRISNLGYTFNPGDELPGYELLNMRLEWQNLMGRQGLTASIFGKNLTDEVYFTGGGGSISLYSLNSAIFGEPRTYGFALRKEF